MTLDASDVLASPQIAGVKVNPRGAGKSKGTSAIGFGSGGLIGAAVGAAASNKAQQRQAQFKAESQTPVFGRLAYLAVTAEEIALVKLKSGIVTLHLDEVIARAPRSTVASADLDSGGIYSPALVITFTSGDTWQLEVPRPSKKHGQAVVDALAV